MEYQPGQRVADYEILERLGQGGMGAVYKVRNALSGRDEVLKVLLPELTEHPELVDRFLREIRVTARLDHPHIARFYTAQRIEGNVVMLLEYVPGKTLSQIIAAGRLPLQRAIDYSCQVLEALAAAHELGVVHRDIKPSNMILTPEGKLKVLDFGIAKAVFTEEMTRTGSTMGSLHYMSPEQVRETTNVDHRADLYSVGVVLYEMVTGARPFTASSDYDLMTAQMQQAPEPPITAVPGLPPSLNDLILMSVAKDPAERFQSATAFRNALQGIAQSLPAAPAVAATAGTAGGEVEATQVGDAGPSSAPTAPHQAPPSPPAMERPAGEAAVTAATPPPPQPKPASGRGVYMLAGAVMALLLVGVAVTYLAGLWPTQAVPLSGEGQALAEQTSETEEAYQEEPTAVTESASVASGQGSPEVGPATGDTSPEAQGAAPTEGETPAASLSRAGSPETSSAGGERQVARPSLPRQTSPEPLLQAAQRQADAPRGQSAPRAVVQAEQVDPDVMAALTDDFSKLALRANVLRSQLDDLEAEQRRMGLSLRGDMAGSRRRMEFLLDQAASALERQDPESAEQKLREASREVEKLEDFLGIL